MAAFLGAEFTKSIVSPRDFFAGDPVGDHIVIADTWLMTAAADAADTVVFGVLPAGYEVYHLALTWSAVLNATAATLDVGLYEVGAAGALGTAIDLDCYIDAADASDTTPVFNAFMGEGGAVGEPAQSTDSLIVMEIQTLTSTGATPTIRLTAWARPVNLTSTT